MEPRRRELVLGAAGLVALYALLPGTAVPTWLLSSLILVAAGVALRTQQRNHEVFPREWTGYLTAYVAWGSMGLLSAVSDASAARVVISLGVAFGCVVFASAIAWFHRTRVVGVDRDWMIDATIVSTSLAIVFWTSTPVTRIAATEFSAIEQGTLAFAALIHLSFLTLTVRLLIITGGRAIRPYLGTSSALLAALGSGSYLVARSAGDAVPVSARALWTLAMIVLAAVTLMPSARYLRETTAPSGRPFVRLGMLGAALVVGTAAILGDRGITVEQTVPAGGALLLVVLVVWRLYGLVTANERAKDRMAKLAAEQSTLAELGRRSLEPIDVPELMGWAADRIRSTLEVDGCEVLPADAVARLEDLDPHRATSAPIAGTDGTYGVLVVRKDRARGFIADEIAFVEAAAVVLAVAVDRITREERMRHASLHDPLTGLPNRTLLLDRLDHALAGAARRGDRVSVLFIDLDRFKAVNDRLGHDCGDELLVSASRRLRSIARANDTLARFGGDEFVLLAEAVSDEQAAVSVARRVVDTLEQPFVVKGHRVVVGASVGIALGGLRATAAELLRRSDAAMYHAKERGGSRFELVGARGA